MNDDERLDDLQFAGLKILQKQPGSALAWMRCC